MVERKKKVQHIRNERTTASVSRDVQIEHLGAVAREAHGSTAGSRRGVRFVPRSGRGGGGQTCALVQRGLSPVLSVYRMATAATSQSRRTVPFQREGAHMRVRRNRRGRAVLAHGNSILSNDIAGKRRSLWEIMGCVCIRDSWRPKFSILYPRIQR